MRIVVLTNLYPPYYLGGYEIRCKEVVEQLRRQGHTLAVLTSQYGLNNSKGTSDKFSGESDIFRVLSFRWLTAIDLWTLYCMELQDHAHLRQLVKLVTPDLFYVWNGGGLSKSLLFHAQSYGIPVVYHIEDDWFLTEFEKDDWLNYCKKEHPINILRMAWRIARTAKTDSDNLRQQSFKTLPGNLSVQSSLKGSIEATQIPHRLKRYYHAALRYLPRNLVLNTVGQILVRYLPVKFEVINFRHACFVSEFRKQQYLQAGVPVADARVIHGGIDTHRFQGRPHEKRSTGQIKLLCVAQLYKGKGIHTVIDALSILQRKHRDIMLTIVGEEAGGKEYTEFLRQKVCQSDFLSNVVRFAGKIPYEQMPTVYQEHDIFIASSIIPEGFPLTIVEAMASGLVVLSTGTGGGKEVVRHGENGLLFPPGDHDTLAQQLHQVIQNSELQRAISQKAIATAQELDNSRVITRIEAYLQEISQRRL